ncbi:endolytic transglycosylase MltG [Roseateles sp.]|uniref:endolytic transglycosylase MltG n=1 Tax=Roseateles sp. TaxID=1971397 RepID=UPI0037C55FE5
MVRNHRKRKASGRLGLFKGLLALLILAAVLAGGAAAGVWWWLQKPLSLASAAVELSVEPGTPPREVAQAWVSAGVQTDARLLYQWFRWSGQARQIRAGSYEVHVGITPRELLAKMVRGDEVLEQVRLIEGWTFRQFRAALAKAPSLKPLTAGMSEAEIMAALGSGGLAAEGRFFPDTYAYSRGVSDLTVLKRAHAAMQRRLDAAWAGRSDGLPLKSADEALILASIIEKETGAPSDRPMVASVFVNRLRIGMLLQTDPTVIYGLGEAFDGNLRKRDLQTDTPFNTYTRGGLPPTPISMPGAASLQAALHPPASRALYFVARGDGSSEFSEDLAAHNRAVNKFQRGR